MAQGACAAFSADAAISVTGIAGPGGGTVEKPVGTVWIGCAVNGKLEAYRSLFPGTRHEIRARATQAALFRLYRALRADEP
jgi:PncC family amidohydrolase